MRRWLTALWLAWSASVVAGPVTVPARAIVYRPESHAWAQVMPIAPLVLRATMAARIGAVRAMPGETVAAGTPLIVFDGPQLDAALTAAHARVQSALRAVTAARRSAASAERTYPALTDRPTLEAAQAAQAAAEAQLVEARAAETSLLAQKTLTSPTTATVGAVSAAAGANVTAGEPVLTLLPQARLRLRAESFAARPATPTDSASFVPADGGPATAVRWIATLPERAANGARVAHFAPVATATWQAGETGELVVRGRPQAAVAVPAGALVLDAGHWYVLTEASGKLAAARVTPGPSQGTDVVITAGLAAGTPVVVREAYLLYHRHFAALYTPPD